MTSLFITEGEEMLPKVTIEIARNPKHDTVESERLYECLEAATSGAVQGYFRLGEKAGSLIKCVNLRFNLADDGSTPIAVIVDMEIENAGIIEWQESQKFTLYKFPTEQPAYLRESVSDLMQQHFKEAVRARRKLLSACDRNLESLLQ